MLFRQLECFCADAREGQLARAPLASIAKRDGERGVPLANDAHNLENLTTAISLGHRSQIRGTSTVRTSSIQTTGDNAP
jgi:hypothetical protein